MANPSQLELEKQIKHHRLELCSLPQALVRLCDLLQNQYPTEDEETIYQSIRFQANPSKAFAPRDIQVINIASDNKPYRVIVTLNFLNLVGASSPLPEFYNDYSESVIGDFLDIFHHRIHQLLWRIVKKYRYGMTFSADGQDKITQNLFRFMGVNGSVQKAYPNLNWRKLLPFTVMLTAKHCSVQSLESILTHYLDIESKVEPCMTSKIVFEQQQLMFLGQQNHQLGSATALGEQLITKSIKFRIHLYNLTWEQCHYFLTHRSWFETLKQLVLFCLKTLVDFDIELHLKPEEIKPFKLTQTSDNFMGWSTWLGSTGKNSVIISEKSYD